MERALELAALGGAGAQPNPMVGAVLVRGDRVIGEGWHGGPGTPHAETQAIACATEPPLGATLFVNLEPCHLQGRTPPCTDSIIAAGIARVVYACEDPNPAELGRSRRILSDAGLIVETGLLAEEAESLNEIYFHLQRLGRPFVLLKCATTLNGKLARADGSSRWISCEESRRLAHRLRACVSAVAVGGETARLDRPRLDLRFLGEDRRPPRPVVFDGDPPSCPADLDFAGREPLLLLPLSAAAAAAAYESRGWRVICLPPGEAGGVDPAAALAALGEAGVSSLMLEGGGRLLSSFLKAGLWDRWELILAPRLFPADGRSIWTENLELGNFALCGARHIGEDLHLSLRQNRGE